ncbi:MFS general substrate transporter [Hysterangium stoloniferum]|nr:MFS general substrate transporter [Hysterangium stoloniferum]
MQLPLWYTTPMAQVILVGITCFCTVGMFSAVSNLGGGGQQDVPLSDTANGVLYGFFALSGLVGGGVCNVLGPSLTLFFGSLGYALYVGALWCHQTQGTRWFLIFAGAILGISAGLLWSAQGEIMMSYPLEKDKGKAFSIFWAIYQFGAFIGSVIALGINIKSGKLDAVATTTYIAFLAIIFLGVASSFLVLGPHRITREDGSRVKAEAKVAVTEEVRDDSFISPLVLHVSNNINEIFPLVLIPMFFASNYYHAYQGAINAAKFDGPTRALNATLQGAGAIVGALMFGFLVLDGNRLWSFKRRTRGYIALGLVTLMTIAVWACGLDWQLTFTRDNSTDSNRINYKEDSYRAKAALFFFYYFVDASYQALVYWIMAALTNDPFTLARFAGFFRALQSAGAAGSFGMDAVNTPFLNELLAGWALMLASFPLAFIVIRTIKETSYSEEQTVYAENFNAESSTGSSTDKVSVQYTASTPTVATVV